MKNIYYWSLFAYIMFFVIATSYNLFPLNDPDSFYYYSVSQHIELPENVFAEFIYNYGFFAGNCFIFLTSLIISSLIFTLCKEINKQKAEISAAFFLWSPTLLFQNSWVGHFDTNMIELILFTMFLLIQILYPKKNEYNFAGFLNYIIFSVVFYIVASLFWKGSIIFIFIQITFILIMLMIYYQDKIFSIIALCGIFCLAILGFFLYPKNMLLIGENTLSIWHYLIFEVIIFIFLFNIFSNQVDKVKKYPQIFFLSAIIFLLFIFVPRIYYFMIPLACIIYCIIDFEFSKKAWVFLGVTFIILTIVSAAYFMKDQNKDIKAFGDPCKKFNVSNCTIVADWSKGHIYRSLWNESVMFKAHPSNMDQMLNLLYYKNDTCKNCVLLYEPEDYSHFNAYVSYMFKNKTQQEISSHIKACFNNTCIIARDIK